MTPIRPSADIAARIYETVVDTQPYRQVLLSIKRQIQVHRCLILPAILNDTPITPTHTRMKRKGLNLTPVERAVAYAKFSKMLTSAHLQALIGGDMNKVLDSVCTLLFIAAAAAHHADILDADVKIIHDACRASVQACSEERLTDLHRGALESGLLAIERLRPRLPVPALVLASTEVSILIRQGGVYWRDFQKYVPE